MKKRIEAFIRYRDIVWYRTFAGLKSESRQYFLGYLWFLLEPAINTLIMYVAFKNILGRGDQNYILFLLLGTLPWQWLESGVMTGMGGIKSKLHIMQFFPLPKYIFPVVGVLTNTWKFLCVFVVLLMFAAFAGHPPTRAYAALPVVLFTQWAFILGLALPLSVVYAYYGDFIYVVSSIFRITYFISGIFFEARSVPDNLLKIYYANPVVPLLESYRDIILYQRLPNWGLLAYTLAWGVGLASLGYVWCLYIDRKILKNVTP